MASKEVPRPGCSFCSHKPAIFSATDNPAIRCCSTTCAKIWAPGPLRCALHAIGSAPDGKRYGEDIGPPAKRSRSGSPPTPTATVACEECEKLLVTDTLMGNAIKAKVLEGFRHQSYFSETAGIVIRYYVPILGETSTDMAGLLAWLRDVTVMTYLQEATSRVCPKLISAGIMPLRDRKLLASHGQPTIFNAGTLVGWVQYELGAVIAAAPAPHYKQQSSLRSILEGHLSRLSQMGRRTVTPPDVTALDALITNVLEDVYELHFVGVVHGALTCDVLFAQEETDPPGDLDPETDIVLKNSHVFRPTTLQRSATEYKFRCVDFSRARITSGAYLVFSEMFVGTNNLADDTSVNDSGKYKPRGGFEHDRADRTREHMDGYDWIKSKLHANNQTLLYDDLRGNEEYVFRTLLTGAMVDQEWQTRQETDNISARPLTDLITLATSMLRIAGEQEKHAPLPPTTESIRGQIIQSFSKFIRRISRAHTQKTGAVITPLGMSAVPRDIYDFDNPVRRRDLPDLFGLNKHAESLPGLIPEQTDVLVLQTDQIPPAESILRLPESWTALDNTDGTCWLNVVIICLACIRAYSYRPLLSIAPAATEPHFRHAMLLFEVINQLWDWMLPTSDPWARPSFVPHRPGVFVMRAPTHSHFATESKVLTPGSLCNAMAIPRNLGSHPPLGLRYLLQIFASGNPPTERALGSSSPWLSVFARTEISSDLATGLAVEQPARVTHTPVQMVYFLDTPEALATDQTTVAETAFSVGIERARLRDATVLKTLIRYAEPFPDILVFATAPSPFLFQIPYSNVPVLIPATYTFPTDYLTPGSVSPTYELFAIVHTSVKHHVVAEVRTAQAKFQRVDNGTVTDLDYTDGIRVNSKDIELVWYAKKQLPAAAPGLWGRLFGGTR